MAREAAKEAAKGAMAMVKEPVPAVEDVVSSARAEADPVKLGWAPDSPQCRK